MDHNDTSLRACLNDLAASSRLARVDAPVSRRLEAAGVLKALEPQPALLTQIAESRFQVAGNLFASKQAVADTFRLPVRGLIPYLVKALQHPTPPRQVEAGACQEVVVGVPDLDQLPILLHTAEDGGPYISSGVMIAAHPQHGPNLDFHRCMQITSNRMAVRVVRNRHFDLYLREMKSLEAAVCVGVPLGVLLAAATSVGIGVDELGIANALQPLDVVKARTVDLWVPADSEFVLEGVVRLEDTHAEGPFVDLTGTHDIVRDQPVFEVRCITHRRDAIWHALLPGGQEHRLLMGMPREPTIFQHVNQVTTCLDVNITPGGASWLHAVVQIEKHSDAEAQAAMRAAFAGHRSCKHVFVVDPDIDIYDPEQVEWAMATRFQGHRGLLVLPPEQGSSLDPSADPQTHFTTKIGFDLTRPLSAPARHFEKVAFPPVDLRTYLPEKTK